MASTLTYIGSGSWSSGLTFQFTTTQAVPPGMLMYCVSMSDKLIDQVTSAGQIMTQVQTISQSTFLTLTTWRYVPNTTVPSGTTINVILHATPSVNAMAGMFTITGYSGTYDSAADNTATGTSASSVSVTTATAIATNYELLPFTVSWRGANTSTFTPAPFMPAVWQTGVGNQINVWTGFQVPNSIGSYTGSGTISISAPSYVAALDAFECNRPKVASLGGGFVW